MSYRFQDSLTKLSKGIIQQFSLTDKLALVKHLLWKVTNIQMHKRMIEQENLLWMKWTLVCRCEQSGRFLNKPPWLKTKQWQSVAHSYKFTTKKYMIYWIRLLSRIPNRGLKIQVWKSVGLKMSNLPLKIYLFSDVMMRNMQFKCTIKALKTKLLRVTT